MNSGPKFGLIFFKREPPPPLFVRRFLIVSAGRSIGSDWKHQCIIHEIYEIPTPYATMCNYPNMQISDAI